MALSTQKWLTLCSVLIGAVLVCIPPCIFALFLLVAGEPDTKHLPTPAQEHLRFVVGASSGTVICLAAIFAVVLFNWRDNLIAERRREIKDGR